MGGDVRELRERWWVGTGQWTEESRLWATGRRGLLKCRCYNGTSERDLESHLIQP